MYQHIKYFKGLNALRFFAAFMVVLHHAEQIRFKNLLFNLKGFTFFNNGAIAVTFFFVLSGFLISYLLLKEQRETANISIRKFYVRRILRIWPLYFLLVLLGTVIIPLTLNLINHPYQIPYSFSEVIWYYIFFSPFMVNILFGHHLLEPLWSIGVEELFYILWAPLFRFLKKHQLAIIIFIIGIKITLLYLSTLFKFDPSVNRIIHMLQFESMAIGGLAAYIMFHRKKMIELCLIFSKPFQILFTTYIVLSLIATKYLTANSVVFEIIYRTPIISKIVLTCAFAWLIVNISINKNSIIKLENKLLNFLGTISYGIYMYHMIVIFAIVLLLKPLLSSLNGIWATSLFYVLLTSGVILVSFLSNKYFEKYFLGLKTKFRAIREKK